MTCFISSVELSLKYDSYRRSKVVLARKFHIMIPKSDWLVSTFLKCIQAYRLSGGEFPELQLSPFLSHNTTSGTILLSLDRSFAFPSPVWDKHTYWRLYCSIKECKFLWKHSSLESWQLHGGSNFHALRKIGGCVWIVWSKFCISDSSLYRIKEEVSYFIISVQNTTSYKFAGLR